MRRFNHWEALKIAFNVLYVASFITLIAFSVSTGVKSQNHNEYTEDEYCPCGPYGSYISCLECDSDYVCLNCDEVN